MSILLRITGIPVILACLFSTAHAGDRLPIPDGTYASEKRFCEMSTSKAIGIFEGAYINIDGNEITYYEAECVIRDVRKKGNTVSFKEVCESEGMANVTKTTWKIIDKNTISINGSRHFRCKTRKRY